MAQCWVELLLGGIKMMSAKSLGSRPAGLNTNPGPSEHGLLLRHERSSPQIPELKASRDLGFRV